jgi:hypothetical protein
MSFKKIYIHHYYSKILFYKLAHNTTDKVFKLENEKRGSVFCKYNGCEFEFVFNPEINDNDDGIHLIDFFAVLFQRNYDNKFHNINIIDVGLFNFSLKFFVYSLKSLAFVAAVSRTYFSSQSKNLSREKNSEENHSFKLFSVYQTNDYLKERKEILELKFNLKEILKRKIELIFVDEEIFFS